MLTNRNAFTITATLAFSALCMAACYALWGFYYTEYEGLNIALLSGSLTPGMAFKQVYFSGNLVISHLYSLLYQSISGVEWISGIEYTLLLIATALGLLSVNHSSAKPLSAAQKLTGGLLLYLLLFAPHHISLIYTRVAYLVCGTALLAMVVFGHTQNSFLNGWKKYTAFLLFFITGTLIRNEAALATLLLALPFAVYYLQSLKKALLLLALPAAIVSAQSLYLAYDITHATNTEYYKQVEPDIEEQYTARQNLLPLSALHTHRDSVLYALASEMSFSDPTNLTPAYLRSLILPEAFYLTDTRQWQRAFTELKEINQQYIALVLLAIALSALLLKRQYATGHKTLLLYALGTVLSFWALTALQAYTDKINERSWLPYLSLFILYLTALALKTPLPRKGTTALVCGAFLLLQAGLQLHTLTQCARGLRTQQQAQRQLLHQIEKTAQGKALVTNSSAFNFLFLSAQPFVPFNYTAFKKIYLTDSYILPFLPYYQKYLEQQCACSMYAYPAIWQYLIKEETGAVVVSTPNRLHAISYYNQQLHGLALPLHNIVLPKDSFTETGIWRLQP